MADQYQMYDDDEDEEPPRRRGLLVPILAIVAGVLAVAVGIAIVLFAMGYFDQGSPQLAGAPVDQPPAQVSEAPPALEPPPPDTAPATTNVPQAVVSVAPSAQGEPPI